MNILWRICKLDVYKRQDLGVKEEDAYNYSAIGCVETAVPGKWGYRCTGMSYLNFPRILLCVMNDGIDLDVYKRQGVIPMADYGLMNGDGVLKFALKLIEDYKK